MEGENVFFVNGNTMMDLDYVEIVRCEDENESFEK